MDDILHHVDPTDSWDWWGGCLLVLPHVFFSAFPSHNRLFLWAFKWRFFNNFPSHKIHLGPLNSWISMIPSSGGAQSSPAGWSSTLSHSHGGGGKWCFYMLFPGVQWTQGLLNHQFIDRGLAILRSNLQYHYFGGNSTLPINSWGLLCPGLIYSYIPLRGAKILNLNGLCCACFASRTWEKLEAVYQSILIRRSRCGTTWGLSR